MAPKRTSLALAAALLLGVPVAGAVPGFHDVIEALTAGTATSPGALFMLALRSAGATSFDEGERAVLEGALSDPLQLLEMPHVPDELIGTIVLQDVGNVHGPRISDIPPDILVSALAVMGDDGRPVPAAALRSYSERASVRNEPAEAQAEDIAAMRE